MKKMMLVDVDTLGGTFGDRRGPMPFDEVKAYKKIKKMLKKEEEEAKKNKKEDPKGWWSKKSIAERTVILSIMGPPAGIGYVFCLLMLVKGLAVTIGVK